MSHGNSQTQLSELILEQACAWFIDLNEGEIDVAGRERFNRWLRRSPEHVRAYLEITAAWESSSSLAGRHGADAATVVAEALAAGNVVRFDSRVRSMDSTESAVSREEQGESLELRRAARIEYRKPRWLLVAAAAFVLFAVAGIAFLSPRNTYTTGIGEQRSIMLEDGSTVSMDVRSQLRVRFSKTGRTVELIEGQALFEVRKETRPFMVLSRETRVRALGTRFDVYRKATGTTVTVVEGRVAVTAGPPTPSVPSARTSEALVLVSGGEQVTVAPQTILHVEPANLAVATAWMQRKLIFDETPLQDAVAEFNRYNSQQIVVEDASLAEYHIRGNFEATEPQRLIQFLRDRFGVGVRQDGNEILISRH